MSVDLVSHIAIMFMGDYSLGIIAVSIILTQLRIKSVLITGQELILSLSRERSSIDSVKKPTRPTTLTSHIP